MRLPRLRLARVLLVTLGLAAPALAAAPSGIGDATNSDIDNPALDVIRHAMPPPDVTKPAVAANVSANPLWAIPLNALTATRNRPLFTPSRRPPAPVMANAPAANPLPPLPPAVPEHPNLVLVGTVVGKAEGIAVFVDPNTHDIVRLHTGEGHNGWVLQVIDGRAVTLQKNDQTETLQLPKPDAMQGASPVVSTLPPAALPQPQNAPSPKNPGQRAGGCMPEPIGC